MNAYQREMRLMPYVLDMERRGVYIDERRLAYDLGVYKEHLTMLDDEICMQLGQSVSINSKDALLKAMLRVGMVNEDKLHRTPTGKFSASKDSLFDAVEEPDLLGPLLVRGALSTCINTFMEPWLESSRENDGKLYVKWNQVRNYSGTGALTGRLSSSPNLQNVPTIWERLLDKLTNIGYYIDFDMPSMRSYIIPKPGYVFISRDYSAQEMRLLANFSNGALLKAIQEDPSMDIHEIAAKLAGISRKQAKTLGFAIIYGAGVGLIAEMLRISIAEATSLKKRYTQAMPEIATLQKEQSNLVKVRMPIVTLAGREYHVEPPKMVQGRMRTFEYKLMNYRIQGSAADQTKEAMYQYCTNTEEGELVLSVHDQLVAQVPRSSAASEMKILEKAMNGSYQDVLLYQVMSDPAVGETFGALK